MLKLKIKAKERVWFALPDGTLISIWIEDGRNGGRYSLWCEAPQCVKIDREGRYPADIPTEGGEDVQRD